MKQSAFTAMDLSFYDISNFEEFGSKHSYSYTYFGNKINLIENHIEREWNLKCIDMNKDKFVDN